MNEAKRALGECMRRCSAGLVRLLAALLALCCTATGAQEADLVVGLNSGVVTRGIALGRNEPSLQVAASYYGSAGWFGSMGGATLRSSTDRNQALLLTGKVGYSWPLSEEWSAQLGYERYMYRSSGWLQPFEHDELSASVAYRDLAVFSIAGLYNARLSNVGSRTSFAYDLTGHYPLKSGLSLAAGVGYQDLHRQSGLGYVYGHYGVGVRIGASQVDISYIMTSSAAKTQFGTSASNRWAAGWTRSF